ncbi:putative MFS transporter [Silvibacterium bohemicum]|uniref:Putative MFS transporter n=1 Tax=Silvibacterium bohemicum TaxID=1577686 RepID=A0A841JTR9_9BACT|nr:MFS transporter [Silvibacterium bohemicum]MBB6143877.1 putative MFS transporter [Silvibacterium bohemicum]
MVATTLLDKSQGARHSAAARIDRLPIGSFQKQIMWLVAYVFFFELGDLNNFGFAAPELRIQWKLSIATIGLITSSAFMGMFVGAIAGGWFSDKVGRKKALILTTICYSISSLLNAFAWNVPGLLVTRFLTGVGLSAMTVVAITYISEMFPAKKRGTYQGWVMTIGLFGIPFSALVAGELIPRIHYGWRLVFVFGALGLFMPLFSRRLEESPRWYENQGRFAEADKALDRIEARSIADSGPLPPLGDEPATTGKHSKFSDLFTPTYLKRTLMLIGVYVFQTLGLFGFMAWVPTLLAARGFPVVKSLLWVSIMYFGAPVGALIAAIISDKWERKYLIAITSVVIAGFGVVYGLSNAMVPIVILGFCVAMFIQTFAPLLYAYTPECYPTEIRSSGSGVAYGAGRLANSLGPMLIAFLFTHYGYKSVFVYIAATWLLVAVIITAFGPKTKDRVLA